MWLTDGLIYVRSQGRSTRGETNLPRLTKIHEVIHSKRLERDAWYLVRDADGRRYVLFETQLMDPGFDRGLYCKKCEVPVKTILAQNNELSRKLRLVLES